MRILITGGAGFIGSNAARRFRELKHEVVLFDNLSRPAARYNLRWVHRLHPDVRFVQGDVRNADDLTIIEREPFDAVLHLAAQVAVTTSIVDPEEDWGSNAVGTFRVLEAIRHRYSSTPEKAPLLIYSSTNKVYGHVSSGETVRDGRWDLATATDGVSESEALSFESPYGCSKGAADQYVLDYHRSYGLPTVSYRQSCIWGTRQFGEEDQGWVAWFALAATFGLPITIYGDGLQVRDLLWVDDLVDAYIAAIERRDVVSGRAYNVGGGPAFRLSLKELIAILEDKLGRKVPFEYGPARLGDQRVFYCDIGRARNDLGWEPKVDPATGVDRLLTWIAQEREEISDFLARKGLRIPASRTESQEP
ncbi:MAG TPA: NAD-dependent epimerase/dehydratase family protein [Thermoanaerobaculia bacterium]|nr:NAD-dependent epimerase/dehydratase family protein [Thermoanaerobaculia bacterium]